MSSGSAKPEERQNGEDDDDGSNKPYNAVHFSSPENLDDAPIGRVGSSKSDEVENRDNDHDRPNQPNDAVHSNSPCDVEKLNGCTGKRFQLIRFEGPSFSQRSEERNTGNSGLTGTRKNCADELPYAERRSLLT
jgi:hypothetical protein